MSSPQHHSRTNDLCSFVRERLPWFHAEALDIEEHDKVAAHLAHCGDCREELELVRQSAELFDTHLSTEQIVEFAMSPLQLVIGDSEIMLSDVESPAESASDNGAMLRRLDASAHINACPNCRSELLLALSVEAGSAAGTNTPHSGSVAGERASAVPLEPSRRSRASLPPLGTAALAASLLALVAAGVLFMRSPASAPAGAVQIRELLSTDDVLRSSSGPPDNAVRFEEHQPLLLLLVPPPLSIDDPIFRAELLTEVSTGADAEPTVGSTFSSLEVNELGSVALLLPWRVLEARDELEVVLKARPRGSDDERDWQSAGRFSLRLTR